VRRARTIRFFCSASGQIIHGLEEGLQALDYFSHHSTFPTISSMSIRSTPGRKDMNVPY
jgi:hypothetical protein